MPSSPPSAHLNVQTRLQRLEHHFSTLRIADEDCRHRLLCTIADNPAKFSPLSKALLDETSFVGDKETLASALLASKEGARLLAYIEAVEKGKSRLGCNSWIYRCPRTAESMIDYKALLVWREMYKWLTVKFVARKM